VIGKRGHSLSSPLGPSCGPLPGCALFWLKKSKDDISLATPQHVCAPEAVRKEWLGEQKSREVRETGFFFPLFRGDVFLT
jgi:hypothetical protein